MEQSKIKNKLTNRMHQALFESFGYTQFRGHQEKIIECLINNQNVVGILPTGSGKSICFQIPAIIFEHTTLVISPLTALMNDQLLNLPKSICGATIHSSQTKKEQQENWAKIESEKLNIIYLSPETALSKTGKKILSIIKVSLFVIDEAHCIDQWGYYFRPEYSRLIEIKNKLLPNVPTLFVTASSNLDSLKKSCSLLQLTNIRLFHQSIYRSNLNIKKIPINKWGEKLFITQKIIAKHQQGVIFCATKDACEYLTRWFKFCGIRIAAYHADLSKQDKQKILINFKNKKIQVVVATSAFGMGIDLPDICWTLHFHPAYTLEDFYQQIGRAGRNDKPANCYFFDYSPDRLKMNIMIYKSQHPFEVKETTQKKFQEVVDIIASNECYYQLLGKYFSENKLEKCGKCSNCERG